MRRFRLFRVRSPLLTESMALSLPALTEMFHFGACGPPSCPGVPGFSSGWVSPFGHPRIEACSAAPRGISQLAASFVASRSQGILHLPLVACPHILEHQYALPSQILSAGFAFVLSLGREPSPVHAKPSRLSQSPVPPRPPPLARPRGLGGTDPPGSHARAGPTPYGELFSFRKSRADS